MRRFLKRALAGLVFLALVALGIHATGRTLDVVALLAKPRHDFDPSRTTRLDYADPESWAALPDRVDRADYLPTGAGAEDLQGRAPADVFFVHPTTYLHGEDWNDPLARDTITEENTQWVLANQASAYNGCCDVYAPRYRQTSLLYNWADAETRRAARELAYGDVEAAFDHFLREWNRGRPFLLAGHSQGTSHARQLLARRISGTPLAKQLVAAFLIGGGVLVEELDALPDLHACRSVGDVRCVVHWETWGEGGGRPERLGRRREEEPRGATLCTNPLSWRVDEERVDRSRHRGAVVPSGRFNVKVWGADRAEGVRFDPLWEPIPKHTWAQCRNGRLFVEPQEDNLFAAYSLGDRDYHGLDYALFYMDLRENAKHRVLAFMNTR